MTSSGHGCQRLPSAPHASVVPHLRHRAIAFRLRVLMAAPFAPRPACGRARESEGATARCLGAVRCTNPTGRRPKPRRRARWRRAGAAFLVVSCFYGNRVRLARVRSAFVCGTKLCSTPPLPHSTYGGRTRGMERVVFPPRLRVPVFDVRAPSALLGPAHESRRTRRLRRRRY